MRKKIIYSIIFFTLFLLSTASMVQPVQGYEVGIPQEAVGVEQVSEIKIFNEDEWENSFGSSGSDPGDIYMGDADVVGARQMNKFIEVENDVGDDEIELIKKVFEKSAAGDGVNMMDGMITSPTTGLLGPTSLVRGSMQAGGGATTNMNMSLGMIATGISNTADLMALYNKDYDGGRVWRHKWYYNEDWETDDDFGDEDKADLDGEDDWEGFGPILGDPRDLKDIYYRLKAMKEDFRSDIMAIRTQLQGTLMEFFDLGSPNPGAGLPPLPPFPYMFESGAWADLYNDTNEAIINNPSAKGALQAVTGGQIARINWTTAGGPDRNITGHEDYLFTYFMFVETALATMYWQTEAFPFDQKLELFISMVPVGGMPFQVPIGDYLARMVKEMNFNDETLYRLPYVSTGVDLNGDGVIKGIQKGRKTLYGQDLGGEWQYVYAYADVYVEGQVLNIDIEYVDGQLDPKDILKGEADPDELSDWEIVQTFGDVGGGGAVWMSGDDILWQAGAIDQIPGYEITILLGVSGISVLAVVYVIMKKRKR